MSSTVPFGRVRSRRVPPRPPSGVIRRVPGASSGGAGFRVELRSEDGWTPLASAPLTVAPDTTHRLRVEAVGPSIKVYVDDMTTPRISVTDGSHTSGANGVRVYEAAARFDDVAVRSPVTGFEASNRPNRFIRHAWGRGRVEANVRPDADMQWKVVPGLADSAAVSLESVNFPGSYLRHRDGEVWMDPFSDTAPYRADATWRRRPGLADPSLVSFESYTDAGRYLRHRDSYLYSEPAGGDTDRADATFRAW